MLQRCTCNSYLNLLAVSDNKQYQDFERNVLVDSLRKL